MGKVYIGNKLLADAKNTTLSAASDVGAIFIWGTNAPPYGCLICDGTAYSRIAYALLFNVIGTAYGAGDGSTTFNVPDLRGKVPVGRDASQTEFDNLNETGGEKSVTLTAAQSGLRDHGHSVNIVPNNAGGACGGTILGYSQASSGSAYYAANTGNINASEQHNNLPPYRVINYVIRYLPSLNETTNLGDTLPIGTEVKWPGNTIPGNWLLENGQGVSRTEYAELFAVIGTIYGAGDGSTTFNVPNMKGVVAVGKDPAQAEFDTLNETGGEKTHTLTAAELPSVNVSTLGSRFSWNKTTGGAESRININAAAASYNNVYTGGGEVATEGGGGAHNTLPPYRIFNFIIKAKNTVPIGAVVEDTLTSAITTNALSAKQGKTLNDKIKIKAIACGRGTAKAGGNIVTFPAGRFSSIPWVTIGQYYITASGGEPDYPVSILYQSINAAQFQASIPSGKPDCEFFWTAIELY